MEPIKVKVEHTVSPQLLSDVLSAAFEGGSNYWLNGVKVLRTPPAGADYLFLADYPRLGGSLDLVVDEPDTLDRRPLEIDAERLAIALQLLAEQFPSLAVDLVAEDYDAACADVFLQLAAFGEVIFG